MQGVAVDITKRKKSEGALREASSKLNALVQAVPLAIVGLDPHGKVISWNPAAERISGWRKAEVIGGSIPIVPEAELEEYKRLWQRLLQGEDLLGLELRRLKKDGSQIDVSLSSAPLYNAAGGFAGAIGIFEDITARKRAEKAAEEIRRQQEAILSNISDIAWLKDRESCLIAVNGPYGRACGMAPLELVGKTDLEIWPRNLALKYRADDQEVMRTGRRKRVEEPLADKEGNITWLETIKTPIFNEHQEVIGTAGLSRDITERRRMEEALRQVSRALKAVTECHQALLRATNETELLSEVCRIIVEVGGYRMAIIVEVGGYRMAWVGYARQDEGKSVEPIAHKGFETGYMQTLKVTWADTERGRGPVGRAIRTGKPAITRDTQEDPHFGPWRQEAHKRGFASVLALPLKDTETFGALAIYAIEPNAFDDEEINLLVGLANDLAFGLKALRTDAEHRRAEEALRESETKYRSLMDGANDAIVLADSRGKITEVNRKAVELLGYPEVELLGMNYLQIHPPRILDHVMENFQGILTSGRGPLHECLIRRKDGEEVPVDITHNMVENADHGVVQAVFRDITARQRAQEALRDSEQKLRLLASQLLAVQETERRRVSRELHDELGQALTVLKINLVAIENGLRGDQKDLKVSCEQLQNYIDTVIENVRRLSRDLSPSILEDLGLSSSLKYLIEEICRNNQMLYTVALDEIDHLFSPEAKINIYRIFQESLTNIVRHAEASRLEVKINQEKNRV
ncbi:MAG: PAS domain S-box protein, partial [Deltaproteobacteria bacterium]|nr:PAS domain S-box protein [Deltaproteobacteria bacterium]